MHPRADRRHITPDDVAAIAATVRSQRRRSSINIEGDPRPELLDLVEEVRPDQCTLVPVVPGEVTSQAGLAARARRPNGLPAVVAAPARGRRARQPVRRPVARPDPLGRVGGRRSRRALHRAVRAGVRAGADDGAPLVRDAMPRRPSSRTSLGLGVNAGHDLDLDNLTLFRDLPFLDEVSIGHAIMLARLCTSGLATVVASISSVSASRRVGATDRSASDTMKSDASRLRHRRDPVRPHRRLDHRIAAGGARPPASAPAAEQASASRRRRLRAPQSSTKRRSTPSRRWPSRRPRTRRRACSSATSISTPSATTMRSSGTSDALKLAPNDVNVSTDLGVSLLLLEPAGQGARAVRSLAQARSQAREDAAERRHRQGVRQAGSRRRRRRRGSRSSRSRRTALKGRPPSARSTASQSGARRRRRRSPVPDAAALRALRRPRRSSSRARSGGSLTASSKACRGGRRASQRCRPRGVQMVRDPVCGTFVVPDRAVTLVDGRARVFFCSDACRDKYRAPDRMSTESLAPRRHRRSRPPHVRARLHGVERRQHQRPARRRSAADDPEERLQGVHDAGHDVHHRSRGHASCRAIAIRRRRC